jgi:hypothetical protein
MKRDQAAGQPEVMPTSRKTRTVLHDQFLDVQYLVGGHGTRAPVFIEDRIHLPLIHVRSPFAVALITPSLTSG